MALYRQIHTKIWADDWFEELDPPDKLLFIYLFSNQQTSPSGIYRITTKRIAFETGLSQDHILNVFGTFDDVGKVLYDEEHHVIWVKNLRRYNETQSPTLQKRIRADIAEIPDCAVKAAYQAAHPNDPQAIPSIDPIPTISTETETETGTGIEAETEIVADHSAPAAASTEMPEQEIMDLLKRPVTRTDRRRWRRLIADYGPTISHYAVNEASECEGHSWAYVATVAQAEYERQHDGPQRIRGP